MRANPLVLPALLAGLVLGLGAVVAAPVSAATAPVDLGTAAAFGVLGASTVTNTGPTLISGDLGLSPGTAVTGFPPGQVDGVVHVADAVALQAQSDTTTAYNSAAGRPSDVTVSADLAGQTLLAGVYSGATLALNGTLTLDGANDPDAVFIFQSGSSLITGPNSSVMLVRGASACNVFWQVGSSATLGVGTSFQGTVAALTSITAETAARITGRLLARNGAVSMDTNTVSRPACAPAPAPSQSASSSPAPTASPTAAPSASPTSAAPAPTPTSPPPATPAPSASPSASPSSTAPDPDPTPTGLPSITVLPAASPTSAAPDPTPAGDPPGTSAPAASPTAAAPGLTSPLQGSSTSGAAQAGPLLPVTGSSVGEVARVALLVLLLGALLTLAGHRPAASRQ